MDDKYKDAIKNFFDAARELKELDIVRSSSYTGDIAEFVCQDLYGVSLSHSQREPGLDGIDENGRKIEVKFHNGKNRNNIIMDKYSEDHAFQDLIVVLGINSCLRPKDAPENCYLIYRFEDYDYSVESNIAKKSLKSKNIDKMLDENFNVI